MYYRGSASKVTKHHVNFVSEILSHDGLFVKDCLSALVEKYMQQFSKISFWSDGGKHFRNFEVAHFMLRELPRQSKEVQWNFFASHHGKSPCDAHFSLLSRWLSDISKQTAICSTAQLVDAWLERFRMSQKRKTEGDGVTDLLNFEIYARSKRKRSCRTLTFPNFSMYFCLEARQGEQCRAKVRTNDCLDSAVVLRAKDCAKEDNREAKQGKPVAVVNFTLSQKQRDVQKKQDDIRLSFLIEKMEQLSISAAPPPPSSSSSSLSSSPSSSSFTSFSHSPLAFTPFCLPRELTASDGADARARKRRKLE